MNLLDFIREFPDETSSKNHWREQREKNGIVCKKCGCTQHRWVDSLEMWECTQCRFRTSLRSGTIMEDSKLPIYEWYIAMHLLTSTKKSFSAKELQRQLGRKRYEPVWAMLHKLRQAMGIRDEAYELEEFVEMDDAFFSTFIHQTSQEIKGQTKEEQSVENDKLKRGKGSQKKSKVLVMAESLPVDENNPNYDKYSKSRKLGYVKMKVVEDLKKETIDQVVDTNIDKASCVRTDASNSFTNLEKNIKTHEFRKVNNKDLVNQYLPWVHTIISNSKRTLLGIHHLIGRGYLQQYLNEFCYKINRRYFGERIFDRLVVAGINCEHYKISQIRYSYVQKSG
jgi:hypothetical protein